MKWRQDHTTLATIPLKPIQFELWIRAVLNWPLPKIIKNTPAICANLLGQNKTGKTRIKGFENLLVDQNISLHFYHKQNCKEGRKMGHVTILNDNQELALKELKRIRSCLIIEGN
jgi:5-(carboxyamino)imidazole ribonucleotide synthase